MLLDICLQKRTLFHKIVPTIAIRTWAPAGGSKGERSLPPVKIKKKKKSLKKNVQTKFFNLQKAPIVCYAKKFPPKWPPCYALNTQKGPHVMR